MAYYMPAFFYANFFFFMKLGSEYFVTWYLHLILLLKTAKWFRCYWKRFLESLLKIAIKANLWDAFIFFHFFKFWKHLAFGPVQYYSTLASTFVRVGAGCHFMLLNIKSTLKGHRFIVTFEKSQKVHHRSSKNAFLEEVHGHWTLAWKYSTHFNM